MKSIRGKTGCEICGIVGPVLDFHHIIPQSHPDCTDLPSNLALVCSNHHRLIHAGEIIIEGVYSTSIGTQLIIHKKGEPYCIRPGIILGPSGLVKILEA